MTDGSAPLKRSGGEARAQSRTKTPIRWRESPTSFPNCSYVAPASCASRSARRKRSRTCSCAASVSRSCRSASMTACRLAARSDTASRRRGMPTRFDAAGSPACETDYSRTGYRLFTSLLRRASAAASAACGLSAACRNDRSPGLARRMRTSRGSRPALESRRPEPWPSSRQSSASPPTSSPPGSTATLSPASTPSPRSARRNDLMISRSAQGSSGCAPTTTANG